MQNLQIPEVHSLKTTPGAGRKTTVTRDISTQKDRKLRKPVFNTTDPGYPASTLFLLEFTATTSKVWLFLVYDLKNSFHKWIVALRRGGMRQVQVWIRITPKSKVSEEPTAKKKKKSREANILLLQPTASLDPRGYLQNISGFKSGCWSCPYKPCGATFPTRRWSAYAVKQQRQTLKLPKFKK